MLEPGLIAGSHWIITPSTVVLIVLGALALRFDYLKWPAISDIAVGVILLALALTPVVNSSLVSFGRSFWDGLSQESYRSGRLSIGATRA